MHGESEPVTLLQTVDGSWSEWGDWGACSKTCLSKNDNFGRNNQNQTFYFFITILPQNLVFDKDLAAVTVRSQKTVAIGAWETK